MHAYFDALDALESAALRGEVVTANEQASALLEHMEDGTWPERWRPHRPAVIEAVTRLSHARTSSEMATQIASVAAACGRCHSALSVHPMLDDGLEPREDDTPTARLERLRWGVERLRDGLVLHSTRAWANGAATVQRNGPPHTTTDLAPGAPPWPDDLLARATAATTIPQRSRIYGEVLASCAGCHAARDAR